MSVLFETKGFDNMFMYVCKSFGLQRIGRIESSVHKVNMCQTCYSDVVSFLESFIIFLCDM